MWKRSAIHIQIDIMSAFEEGEGGGVLLLEAGAGITSICLDSKSIEKSRGWESTFANSSNSNLTEPKLVLRNFA